MRARGGAVLVWLLLSGATASAGDATLAEGLFREGKALMQAGDYAAACPKLAESFRQDPATGTLLALAVCHEASGHLASAWTSYQGVVARASQEGRADRATAARERMAALEPRLSMLTVDVPPDIAARPGLVLMRDGAPLPPAAWGVAVPIDAGTHALAALVDGHPAWRATVTVGADADRKSVRVVALDVRAAETDPRGAAGLSSVVKRREDEPPHASTRPALVNAGITVAGIGVAALGVGTALALHARSLNSQSFVDGHCDKVTGCDAVGAPLNERAVSYANAATVSFVGGGALVASGIVLILMGRTREGAAPSVSLALPPPVVGSGTGLGLVGTF